MICEICGKYKATTHIHTVINGATADKHLCSYCAAKHGNGSVNHNSLANMVASMFNDFAPTKISEKRCECCNTSFSDIAKTGKVGCAECYKTFYDELLPYIKRLHSATTHIGKKPKAPEVNGGLISVKAEETSLAISRISTLKEELKSAVEREEFELAAKLRDEIKSLESEGENK